MIVGRSAMDENSGSHTDNAQSIEIRAQRRLGLVGASRLCIKGITHRLLRSVLTLAVVTLAVAFFMFLLSENALVAASAGVVRRELAEQRFPAGLLGRLFDLPASLTLAERLGASVGRPATRKEMADVTGLDPAWLEALAVQARREQEYFRFFGALSPGRRLVLVQKWEGRDIFRFLADAGEREAFARKLSSMKEQRLPGGMEKFHVFLAGFQDYLAGMETLEKRWRVALEAFAGEAARRTGGADFETWLAGSDPRTLREWALFARSKGFDTTQAQWETVQAQLRLLRAKQAIIRKLTTPEARAEWRRVFRNRKPLSVEKKLLHLDDPRSERLLDGVSSREERIAVGRAVAQENRLAALERKLAGRVADDKAEGGALSPRQAFLLLISFIVCAVGVGNAMLMSITERFREIATMKCLGATDGYILTQFMLEAALQGCAGGALGMVIGFVAAVAKESAILGATVFAAWPGWALCGAGAIALGAGVLLSVSASVYPAWAASRMAPMEAMRVE